MRRKEMKKIGGEINAFLGEGTEFEGKLTFTGTVRIDGNFHGEIRTEGHLIVGETAKVKAEIQVASIIISGQVIGNIRASQRVEIHTPGRLYGNIFSPVLVIDEGVVFEGACRMETRSEKGVLPAKEKVVPELSKKVLKEKVETVRQV